MALRRVRAGRRTQVEGLPELLAQLASIGEDFPKSVLDDISAKAVQLPLMTARQNAPLGYTHQLEEGIITIKENNKKGVSARQVVIDRGKNSVFQKPIPDPNAQHPQGAGTRGGKSSSGYYPASIEFGFHRTKAKKVMGQFYMLKAAKKNRPKVRKLISNQLKQAIDRLT